MLSAPGSNFEPQMKINDKIPHVPPGCTLILKQVMLSNTAPLITIKNPIGEDNRTQA